MAKPGLATSFTVFSLTCKEAKQVCAQGVNSTLQNCWHAGVVQEASGAGSEVRARRRRRVAWLATLQANQSSMLGP